MLNRGRKITKDIYGGNGNTKKTKRNWKKEKDMQHWMLALC